MIREIAEDTLQEELEMRYRQHFARNNPKPALTREQVLVKALGSGTDTAASDCVASFENLLCLTPRCVPGMALSPSHSCFQRPVIED